MTFPVLLLLFTVVPAVEIALFVQVGGVIGTFNTFGVVLFTGIAGAALARSQGFALLTQVQANLARGLMPTDELVEGAVVLFGGALLLTPGFMTDIFGLSCLLPMTRKGIATLLRRWAKARVTRVGPGRANVGGFRMWTGGVHPGPGARSGFQPPPEGFRPPPSGTRSPHSDHGDESNHRGGYRSPFGPADVIDASFSVEDDDSVT